MVVAALVPHQKNIGYTGGRWADLPQKEKTPKSQSDGRECERDACDATNDSRLVRAVQRSELADCRRAPSIGASEHCVAASRVTNQRYDASDNKMELCKTRVSCACAEP